MIKSKYIIISVLVLGLLLQYILIGTVSATIFQPKPPPPDGNDPGPGLPGQGMGPIEIFLSAIYLILLIGTLIAIAVKKSKEDERI